MVRHRFESEVVDAGDPDEVGPDEWNDDHLGGVGAAADYWRIDDEFFSFNSPWANHTIDDVVNGTGAAVANNNSEANHPGTIGLSTGTTTTGRAAIAASSSQQMPVGNGAIKFGIILKTPTSLSDGTNRYKIWVGPSGISTGAPPSWGIGFSYTDNENSGNWTAISNTSGSDSAVDTGVAVTTTTWWKMEVEINAAATEVKFYINGTLEHTETTNIETSNQHVIVPAGIFKSLGTTARFMLVDAFWLEQALTTSR
jgi:hypothetical protein